MENGTGSNTHHAGDAEIGSAEALSPCCTRSLSEENGDDGVGTVVLILAKQGGAL